jgi:crossover junction endodeoxyribonuclease RusA
MAGPVSGWLIETDWARPPLSLNDRGSWRASAGTIANVRREANIRTRAARIPKLSHVTVQMIWTVPDRRRRDEENPVSTLKPWCDGMVDAGVVRDDTPNWMTKPMPVIEYVKGQTGVRFVITGETET